MATIGPQLLHIDPSKDTIACATRLAEGALGGDVVGAVIGFIYRRRRYSISVCGEAHRDPTFARGIVRAIDDELQAMVHDRANQDTTL